MKEKKLEVKNLSINFKTDNGLVHAVRNVDFDLYKGETLAIVGESGSGKSVTNRAIMGILAHNGVVESGEIIYNGQDLLKIDEEDFHKLRGDKIAMIFQDPLSSLNPIVKIGTQLTEAMLLKGKARQKESRNNFNRYLKNLKDCMVECIAEGNTETANKLIEKCNNFDKFEYAHLALENQYNKAYESAEESSEELDDLIFEISKNGAQDVNYRINYYVKLALLAINPYVVHDKKDELTELVSKARVQFALAKRKKKQPQAEKFKELSLTLKEISAILKEALSFEAPNFFAMGYYTTFSGQSLPELPVNQLNDYLRKYLDDNFMLDFINDAKKALEYSAEKAYAKKAEAIAVLNQSLTAFKKENLDKAECFTLFKQLQDKLEEANDKLELLKDSTACTFPTALKSQLEMYFNAPKKNQKEQKRFDDQTKKYNDIIAKGKTPDYKVIPASLTDLEVVKDNIIKLFENLINHFQSVIDNKGSRDFEKETVDVIDYLKANASGVVYKVTKSMAKAKAIKLMDEVGILEPRKRYNQYPFEFSGGMRQRIVIAIALAANPDILICDEPTTALDVTIQSQILELINKLKRERGLTVIFITHDLGVVANMADRIAVMYAGKIVEYGTSDDIFYDPRHPYTWALLSSMPDLDTDEKLDAIPGTPPNMIYPPQGDAFASRNKYAMEIDFELQPPMFKISETHSASTWLLHPNAPKTDPPKQVTERIKRMQKLHGGQQ